MHYPLPLSQNQYCLDLLKCTRIEFVINLIFQIHFRNLLSGKKSNWPKCWTRSSHSFILVSLSFLIPFSVCVCSFVCLCWTPAAQNAISNADFANFDAFNSSAAQTTAAFPSVPQAPFQPAQPGTSTYLQPPVRIMAPCPSRVVRNVT